LKGKVSALISVDYIFARFWVLKKSLRISKCLKISHVFVRFNAFALEQRNENTAFYPCLNAVLLRFG